MKNGQMSFEFMETVFMLTIIFSIMSLFIYLEFAEYFPEPFQQQETNRLSREVAMEIDRANIWGEGYYSTMELPEQVAGKPYEIYFGEEYRAIEMVTENYSGVSGFSENAIYKANNKNLTIASGKGRVVVS